MGLSVNIHTVGRLILPILLNEGKNGLYTVFYKLIHRENEPPCCRMEEQRGAEQSNHFSTSCPIEVDLIRALNLYLITHYMLLWIRMSTKLLKCEC